LDYTFLKNASVNFVIHWFLFCKFNTKWYLIKVKTVTVFAVIISGIIALPINISRQVMTYEFNLTTNSSLVLHTYGKIFWNKD
jgi:histidinol phosphatase-like PHP family hydrolase